MKSILSFIAVAGLLASAQLTFAKNIDLYDQPKADSKVVGKIDSEAGIIPIYTPKDNTWVKVADPRNGNVGWIKSTDLNGNGTSFTFTQSVFNNGTSAQPQSYVIQFGGPQKLTPEQAQAMYKQMQSRQEALQRDMQAMINGMFKTTNFPTPIFVPVIMVPQTAAPVTNNTPTPAKK
ncbi:MAG: SH3 domain-containing protein [Gammaproteobacteria bacterium]